MDTERYIVAVEIGSSKITGAIGTRSLKGVVTVLGVDTEPLTGSVKRGFVVNPDEVSSKVKRLIRKLNNRIGASKKNQTGVCGNRGTIFTCRRPHDKPRLSRRNSHYGGHYQTLAGGSPGNAYCRSRYIGGRSYRSTCR